MMDIIFSETNFNPDNIKIIQCVAAHNEEDWVSYPILSIYNEIDIVLLIEGAVKGRPNSTEGGHSTDKTLDIIRKIPDPNSKIKLITKDGFFKDLEEQKQIFLDQAEKIQKEHPEWTIYVLINDADEVITPETIKRLRAAIKLRPWASEFILTFLHFFHDFDHVSSPSDQYNILHQRFFKYQVGMKYRTHPVVSDADGIDTCLDPRYQSFRFQIKDMFIHHYGNTKALDFQKAKAAFYKSELAKYGAADEAQQKYKVFNERLEKPEDILLFTGQHPEVMKSHPLFKHRDEKLAEWDKEGLCKKWTDNIYYSGIPLPLIFCYDYLRDQELWHTNPLEV